MKAPFDAEAFAEELNAELVEIFAEAVEKDAGKADSASYTQDASDDETVEVNTDSD